jgi:hypothetical protein
MSKLLEQDARLALAKRQFSYWDDFHWYVTAHMWTSVISDSGTISVGDAHGGVLTIAASDGNSPDNDESYLKSTAEIFKFDIDNTMRCGALLKFTEANTDDANVAFGWMNAVAANSIQDDGAGPAASFSGAVFYKVDGGTVWRVRSSIGTTYTDTVLTNASNGAAYQLLEIEYKAISLTRGLVSFYIDGAVCLDPDAGYAKPLLHTVDATSATEMNLFAGIKCGGASAESLLVDGMGFSSIR